jgi:hypothetical protein
LELLLMHSLQLVEQGAQVLATRKKAEGQARVQVAEAVLRIE